MDDEMQISVVCEIEGYIDKERFSPSGLLAVVGLIGAIADVIWEFSPFGPIPIIGMALLSCLYWIFVKGKLNGARTALKIAKEQMNYKSYNNG